jgi:hypothetical protein
LATFGSEFFILQQCREPLGKRAGSDGEIDESRAGDRRLVRHPGDFDFVRQLCGEGTGVRLQMLRQQHGRVSLVISKACVRDRRYLRHKAVRQRLTKSGQGCIHPLLQ